MPVYRYKCSCGYEHDQFLRSDRDSIILKCERCSNNISARQVRDNSAKLVEKDEVVGVLRHESD